MPRAHVDILLVEDSEDDAMFFAHALKDAGASAQVRVARNGVEALTEIFGGVNATDKPPRILPRLIVLDLKLPKISGLEVLQKLKANPHTRSVPVVILSSSCEKRDLAQCYELGANSYLVKPMDFDEYGGLVALLNRYWLGFNRLPTPEALHEATPKRTDR